MDEIMHGSSYHNAQRILAIIMTPTYNSSLDELIYVKDLEVCLPESALNNNNNN